MSINTIIFDFGSVLVKGVPSLIFDNLDIKSKDIDIMKSSLHSLFNKSNIDLMETEEIISLYTDKLPNHLKKFAKDIYMSYATSLEVMEYTVPLLESLKEKGYKLYYLSNWDKSSFNLCKKKGIFDYIKYFDGGVISHEVGLLKPNKEIYEFLIEKFHIERENCLFIDDKQENISAAKDVGLNAIIFNENTLKILMSLEQLEHSNMTESTNINRKDILDKVIKIIENSGIKPKITKSSKEKWIKGEDVPMWGDSLCIAGLGKTDLVKLSNEINKVIKPKASVSPDNYGTMFLHINESVDSCSLLTNQSLKMLIYESELSGEISPKERKVIMDVFESSFNDSDRKGYWTGGDYMGWNPKKKQYEKFVSDKEYHEFFDSLDDDDNDESA